MKIIMNRIFKNIVTHLKTQNITINNSEDDGRVTSILNDDDIISKIIDFSSNKKYEIEKGKSRNWFDFSIKFKLDENDDEEIIIPVNVKLTKEFGNDNVNSLNGLLWAFREMSVDEASGNLSWAKKVEILKRKPPENYRDYYFLIINKTDKKDIFFTSFKQMEELKPNGNNLPFQANWNKNRKLVSRTYHDAEKFCLDMLVASIDKNNDKTQFAKTWKSESKKRLKTKEKSLKF